MRPATLAESRRAFLFTKGEKKMKIDLASVFKELGLPLGLVALFAAVLGLTGVSLDAVLLVVQGLIGTFALIALLINILKWAGVVTDGNAGKWSAVANLIMLVIVSVVFKLYPQFDFAAFDAHAAEFARVAGIVFAYILQIVGTKSAHRAMAYGLNIKAFSHQLNGANRKAPDYF
jgi:hypothetical protein